MLVRFSLVQLKTSVTLDAPAAYSAYDGLGFRVASPPSSAPPAVPEPSMMVIGTLFGLGGLVAKRRRKK
jgi:LPXTG-motif cell wall-anchored protein